MGATIRDIANALNISHTTVSRVLNGKGQEYISETTRQRVLATAKEMKYRRNHAAHALATGRTNLIVLWMPNIRYPYFVNIMQHTLEQVRGHNRELLIRMVPRTDELVSESQWHVDGILALDNPNHVNALLDAALPNCPPIVGIGSYPAQRTDYVGLDLSLGATEAVQHLLDIGCQRIAYLVNNWGCHPGDARYDSYTNVIQAAGRKPEYILTPDSSREAARRTLREYVQTNGHPDGLFCLCDDMAMGAYRGLLDIGLRVPEDVALVGCDGIEEGEYLERPLSTIIQPHAEMCARAWEVLMRRIQDPSQPLYQEMLPTHLCIRASSQRATR